MGANSEGLARYRSREGDLDPYVSVSERLPLNTQENDSDKSLSSTISRPVRYRHFSSPFRRSQGAIVTWLRGPQPPQIQVIRPWLPSLQEAPLRLLQKSVPGRKSRVALLVVFFLLWAISFNILVSRSRQKSILEGYGHITPISCIETLWYSGNSCGLHGIDCRPFSGKSLAFRCPANCASVQLLNPRTIGDQEIIYRPLVVGGPIYRGDSFICGAAIHAGIITDNGDCGVITWIGQHRDFPGTNQNGISSVGFDSYFPLSFSFEGAKCGKQRPRWPLPFISLTFTTLISLFTTSPAVFFYTVFVSIFAHVGFVSDPPSLQQLSELSSDLIGKFLPAIFCALAIFRYYVRLQGITAQIEKTILWLGGCWFGALANYTFGWIPLARLTSHDLERQPGAKVALVAIVTLLACIVCQQIYYFRLEGRLRSYLALYGTFVGTIILLVIASGMNVRIHHYVLALLLLPGTSLQTRSSLLYQGILVGLFINGVARWGFDPVLQTDRALRGDGRYDSVLPFVPEPIISTGIASNITFSWALPSSVDAGSKSRFDGISIFVNDVERYRQYFEQDAGVEMSFTWKRAFDGPEYFRFGYIEGRATFDYTTAGIWLANGTWTGIEPGP